MIKSHQTKIWKEAFKFWNRVNVDNRKNIKQSVFSVARVVEKKNKTK